MSVKRSVNTSPQTPGAVTKTSRTSIQTINLGHRVVKQVWVSRGMFLLCKRSLVPEIGLFRTNRPIQRRNSPKNVIQPHYITTLSLLWEDGPQFVSRLQRTLFIGKSPPDLRHVNSKMDLLVIQSKTPLHLADQHVMTQTYIPLDAWASKFNKIIAGMCYYTMCIENRDASILRLDVLGNGWYVMARITEALKAFLLHLILRDPLIVCSRVLIYIP